ncbi:MAG: hypothetical protein IKI64_02095 [Clostridia bacterium]|nr:hypothetical protein [Clostridia bacterium]
MMRKIRITAAAILAVTICAFAMAVSSCRMARELPEAITVVFHGHGALAVQRIGLSAPKDKYEIETLYDDRGGLQNDGEVVYKLSFSEDAAEYFSDWDELPVSAEAAKCLYRVVRDVVLPVTDEIKAYVKGHEELYADLSSWDGIMLPEIERGCWKLIKRGELSGRISNFTFCVYDAESNTAYIIEFDL